MSYAGEFFAQIVGSGFVPKTVAIGTTFQMERHITQPIVVMTDRTVCRGRST